MSSFIEFTTIALVLVYIGVADGRSAPAAPSRYIGASCAFLIGGFFFSFSRWLTRWPPWCAGWPPLQSFWHYRGAFFG